MDLFDLFGDFSNEADCTGCEPSPCKRRSLFPHLNSIVSDFQLHTTDPSISNHSIPKTISKHVIGNEYTLSENGICWIKIDTFSNFSWHISLSPLATRTVKAAIGLVAKRSILANFVLIKLCVDPLSIRTTISYDPILALTHIVCDVAHPVNAW